MQKLKVGFFGGSFNPPINTHLNIAKSLLENKILDKVIFVPVGDYYLKQDLIEAKHRFNMLKIMCEKHDKIEVEEIAASSNKMLYASDTFELLYNKYNEIYDIYLIMGSDNFEKMPTWKNYSEIINRYNFIVIERNKYKLNSNMPNVKYVELKDINDITSTLIRKRICNKEEVSSYINSNVMNYIKENKLYI